MTSALTPIFIVRAGSPLITLEGLCFAHNLGSPPIVVLGGRLKLIRCNFTSNRAAALRVSGGEVTVHESRFARNGHVTQQLCGGAIVAIGGSRVAIFTSAFVANQAADGGAVYAAGSASVQMNDCKIDNNNASARGGALCILSSAGMVLSNRTRLKQNWAPNGSSIYLAIDGAAMYVLPAPLSHWVSNTKPCSSRNELCPSGATVTELSAGGLDNDFPFICGACPNA
jgi:predicted outer membrane repeat protein